MNPFILKNEGKMTEEQDKKEFEEWLGVNVMEDNHIVVGDGEIKADGHKPSDLNELLCCPFCKCKGTFISKEDSDFQRDMVTCKNEECELTDWIPYDDWQQREI